MDLATAIGQMEGWGVPGSIATRNNNPGNLRYSPYQSGSEKTVNGTFATFSSPDVGWSALQDYIDTKAKSGVTLRDFIYTYAPPTENNTANYLQYLSGQLGIGADSPLDSLYGVAVDSVGSSNSTVSDLLSNDTSQTSMLVGVGIVAVIGIVLLSR